MEMKKIINILSVVLILGLWLFFVKQDIDIKKAFKPIDYRKASLACSDSLKCQLIGENNQVLEKFSYQDVSSFKVDFEKRSIRRVYRYWAELKNGQKILLGSNLDKNLLADGNYGSNSRTYKAKHFAHYPARFGLPNK